MQQIQPNCMSNATESSNYRLMLIRTGFWVSCAPYNESRINRILSKYYFCCWRKIRVRADSRKIQALTVIGQYLLLGGIFCIALQNLPWTNFIHFKEVIIVECLKLLALLSILKILRSISSDPSRNFMGPFCDISTL